MGAQGFLWVFDPESGSEIRIPAKFRHSVAKFRRFRKQPPDFLCAFGTRRLPGISLAVIPGMPSPRPWKPVKTYYLELDGKPSCVSNLSPTAYPVWSCGHGSHQEAQEAAKLVWRDHPGCAIAIREGPCPRTGEVYEDPWEEYD